MNYFDIIVAVPLIWSVYKGVKKGFIIEVSTLIALFLGVYGGLNFSNYASEWIHENWEVSTNILPLLSFSVTFIVIVIVINLLAKLLEKVIKMAALGIANRIFGGLFGLIKITFVCGIVVYIIDTVDYRYDVISDEFRSESVLYEPLSKIAPTILPLFTKWQTVDFAS